MIDTATPAGTHVVACATPYPWPYHGQFNPRQSALVACLDDRWRGQGPRADASDARLERLATKLRALGVLIVAVTATPMRHSFHAVSKEDRSPTHAVSGTWLYPDVVTTAGGTSAFYASPLDEILRAAKRSDLFIVGWGLEGPVHSTMRSANDRGYECLLVPDACTSIDAELEFASCEMVRYSGGIFGAHASTSETLAAIGEPTASRSIR